MANGEQAGDPREELVPDDGSPTAAPHPEEMKATIEFRVGKSISLTASHQHVGGAGGTGSHPAGSALGGPPAA